MSSSEKPKGSHSILPKELDELDKGWGDEAPSPAVYRSSTPLKRGLSSTRPLPEPPLLTDADSWTPLSEPVIRESEPSLSTQKNKAQQEQLPKSHQVTKAPDLPADEFAKNLMESADALEANAKSVTTNKLKHSSKTGAEELLQEAPRPPELNLEPSDSRSDLPTRPPPAWFTQSEQARRQVLSKNEAPVFRPETNLTEAPPKAIKGSPADLANALLAKELAVLSTRSQKLNQQRAEMANNRPAQRHNHVGEVDTIDSQNDKASAHVVMEPLKEMDARFAMGDFSGALIIANEVLAEKPNSHEALAASQKCKEVLHDMYLSRLGSLAKVPRVLIAGDQIRWLSLDHKSGFLISMIDGTLNIEKTR